MRVDTHCAVIWGGTGVRGNTKKSLATGHAHSSIQLNSVCYSHDSYVKGSRKKHEKLDEPRWASLCTALRGAVSEIVFILRLPTA